MVDLNRYEKISDDLYILGYNTILRFNVSLGNKAKDGTRRPFHNEFQYSSDKYIDKAKLSSIRRNFDYFLSIENMKADEQGVKEFIMIRIQDILYVREQFNLAIKWFRSEEFKNLFARKDNKLIMLGRVEPICIYDLTLGKSLRLEPVVLNYESNSMTGVRLYLSSLDNYVDMNVDKFMGLMYLINSINMYESAQLLLNYIQRPELGTNQFSFDNGSYEYDDEAYTVSNKNTDGRKVENYKKQNSFFDRMKGIE